MSVGAFVRWENLGTSARFGDLDLSVEPLGAGGFRYRVERDGKTLTVGATNEKSVAQDRAVAAARREMER